MPTPRRSSGRRAAPPSYDRESPVKIVLGVICLIGLIGVLGFTYFKSQSAQIETDANTLCPTKQPIKDVMAVLIDASDLLSDGQKVDIVNRLERRRQTLPRFGLFELYVLSSDDGELLHPVLSICNPGNGEGMNSLYENPEIALRHWTRDFKSKIDAVVAEAITKPDSAQSPVLEAIKSIALLSFGSADRYQATHELVIVSDLLQNVSGQYSQYQTPPDFQTFSKLPYYTSVRSDLQGTKVDVLYLTRPANSAIQGRKHVDFWDQYFKAQGAELSQVDRIF